MSVPRPRGYGKGMISDFGILVVARFMVRLWGYDLVYLIYREQHRTITRLLAGVGLLNHEATLHWNFFVNSIF